MDIQLEIALAAGLLIAAVAVAIWSLRGRRVGTEPHCRRCGYDLRGMPDGVKRCSECGADLSGSKAIVAGVVTNRKRWLWLSAILLLAASVPTVTVVQSFREEGWTHLKPLWLLRIQLGSSDMVARNDADIELLRRSMKGLISAEDKLGIAKWAAHHDFRSSPLPPIVVDFALESRLAGILPQADWDALWHVRILPQITMKKSFRWQEHPLADVRFPALPQGRNVKPTVNFLSSAATLDGAPLKNGFPGIMVWVLPECTPGVHRLTIKISFEFVNASSFFKTRTVEQIDTPLLAEFEVEPPLPTTQ